VQPHERELIVARICSGTVRCPVHFDGRNTTIIMRQPTREQLYIAAELFTDVFRESELEGLFSEDELYAFLMDNDLWTLEKDKQYVGLPKDIEEFKLKLFKLTFKSNERQVARKALALAKSVYAGLAAERAMYAHLSCQGAANLARNRYLLGCSMYYPNGSPVFVGETFWEEPSDLLDLVMQSQSHLRLGEEAIREIARTDPWRSIWICRKGEGHVFGVSPVDYTEEQRSLVGWSNLYDNIYEHPDCPSDDIIEDDDMLDGWLIDQRRQREARQLKKSAEDIVSNEKIRGSSEIFVPAGTSKDAAKINELNDEMTRGLLKQRFDYLKKHGKVAEQDMPDTKRRLQMAAADLGAKAITGKTQ